MKISWNPRHTYPNSVMNAGYGNAAKEMLRDSEEELSQGLSGSKAMKGSSVLEVEWLRSMVFGRVE